MGLDEEVDNLLKPTTNRGETIQRRSARQATTAATAGSCVETKPFNNNSMQSMAFDTDPESDNESALSSTHSMATPSFGMDSDSRQPSEQNTTPVAKRRKLVQGPDYEEQLQSQSSEATEVLDLQDQGSKKTVDWTSLRPTTALRQSSRLTTVTASNQMEASNNTSNKRKRPRRHTPAKSKAANVRALDDDDSVTPRAGPSQKRNLVIAGNAVAPGSEPVDEDMLDAVGEDDDDFFLHANPAQIHSQTLHTGTHVPRAELAKMLDQVVSDVSQPRGPVDLSRLTEKSRKELLDLDHEAWRMALGSITRADCVGFEDGSVNSYWRCAFQLPRERFWEQTYTPFKFYGPRKEWCDKRYSRDLTPEDHMHAVTTALDYGLPAWWFDGIENAVRHRFPDGWKPCYKEQDEAVRMPPAMSSTVAAGPTIIQQRTVAPNPLNQGQMQSFQGPYNLQRAQHPYTDVMMSPATSPFVSDGTSGRTNPYASNNTISAGVQASHFGQSFQQASPSSYPIGGALRPTNLQRAAHAAAMQFYGAQRRLEPQAVRLHQVSLI